MLWMIRLRRLFKAVGREALMLWYALRNPATPVAIKIATVLLGVYLISPLDLITDAVPLLGWLDDGIVVFLLLRLSQKLLPPGLSEALKARGAARRR